MSSSFSPNIPKPPATSTRAKQLFVIGVLFFIFGFDTWLGSVLIPYLKIACQLNSNIESYLVAFSFYISYMVFALPSAVVLKKTGYKKGMALGLLLMAAGTLLFIPAALSRTYMMFLTGLFVQGSGLAILQTAVNPYVVMLGPVDSAAKRISIMGICNGVAGILGPLVLGSIILNDTDAIKNALPGADAATKAAMLHLLSNKVIIPYLCMTVILLVMAVLIYFSNLPETDAESETTEINASTPSRTSIFRFPHLLLGVFTLFLYVGVEVIAGDTIINYGSSQNIALSTAKFFTSCTLGGMLLGYVAGIICIPAYFSQKQALCGSAIAGICFSVLALATRGYVSVAFVALLGLANSLIWPSIWPLALEGLGKFTKTGASLLIMAIGGGAVLPLLYGWLTDKFSAHNAYWIVVPCYAVILFYALKGHRLKMQS
jgi:MFS transporter, FHS family, L-fucose permease